MILNYFGSTANLTGFISLFLYILSLTPTLVRIFFKNYRKSLWNRYLTRKRREIGVLAWIFGFIHGAYIIFERNLNFFELETFKSYFQGLTLITIFTILAITSNDFSQKKLKRNWKTIHKLTYIVLIFLPWHILDKMFELGNSPTIWTYLGLFLIFIIGFLSLIRFYKFLSKKRGKR